jgi:hypothetical protein
LTIPRVFAAAPSRWIKPRRAAPALVASLDPEQRRNNAGKIHWLGKKEAPGSNPGAFKSIRIIHVHPRDPRFDMLTADASTKFKAGDTISPPHAA